MLVMTWIHHFLVTRQRKKKEGGDCTAVISSPGLLVKNVFMQSKIAFYTTNHENMHTCKTSEEFLHNFSYKYMKYSNKAKQDNFITDLLISSYAKNEFSLLGRYLFTKE